MNAEITANVHAPDPEGARKLLARTDIHAHEGIEAEAAPNVHAASANENHPDHDHVREIARAEDHDARRSPPDQTEMLEIMSKMVKAATEASTTQLIAALKATRPTASASTVKVKSDQVIRGEIPKIPFVSHG